MIYGGNKDSDCLGATSSLTLAIDGDDIYTFNLDSENLMSISDSYQIDYTIFDAEVPTPVLVSLEVKLDAGGSIGYNLNLNADASMTLAFNGEADLSGSVGINFFASVSVFVEGTFLDTTLTYDLSLVNNNGNCEANLSVELDEDPFTLSVGLNY